MTKSLERMFDVTDTKGSLSVGGGRKMKMLKIGMGRRTAIDLEGKRRKIIICTGFDGQFARTRRKTAHELESISC
jgi:hypothetical protein